ncbi:12552_t:CDS:2, partial [Acaulospora morrowiae]
SSSSEPDTGISQFSLVKRSPTWNNCATNCYIHTVWDKKTVTKLYITDLSLERPIHDISSHRYIQTIMKPQLLLKMF